MFIWHTPFEVTVGFVLSSLDFIADGLRLIDDIEIAANFRIHVYRVVFKLNIDDSKRFV